MNANDRQVDGDHYRAGYQHWDFMLDNQLGPPGWVYAITKYVTRWQKKNGVKDLEKALHYADKLFETISNGAVPERFISTVPYGLTRFIRENNLGSTEAFVIHQIMTWSTAEHVDAVRTAIHQLIGFAKSRGLGVTAG